MPLIALLIAVVGVMIIVVLAWLLATLLTKEQTWQAVAFIGIAIVLIAVAWCVLGVLAANDPILGIIREAM